MTIFQKAFDTIHYEVLLDKLRYYGISGTVLKVLKTIYWTENIMLCKDRYLSPMLSSTRRMHQWVNRCDRQIKIYCVCR